MLEIGGVQMMFVLPETTPTAAAAHDTDSSDEEAKRIASKYKTSTPGIPPKMSVGQSPLSPNVDYSLDSAKDVKPPLSYATLIAQAINSTEEKRMTLSGIYGFIADHYSFYRHAGAGGWQVGYNLCSRCLLIVAELYTT